MTYTFVPKQKYAKAYGRNMRISRKNAVVICRVISRKPLVRSERLLNNLLGKKQSLRGKYHTNAAADIKKLVESCKKNAEFLNLDMDKLFVHASAHQGTIMRRRRRKSAFGSRMKSTNVEIMLIEKGKERSTDAKGVNQLAKKKSDVIVVRDEKEIKKAIEDVAKKVAEKQKVSKEKKIDDKKEDKTHQEKHKVEA